MNKKLVTFALCAMLFAAALVCCQELVKFSVKANATIENEETFTVEGIGAGQGVSLHDGHLYFYGDVSSNTKVGGVIREFTFDMKPTGRDIKLSAAGKPVVTHPTGLTWHDPWGCFIGDTVNGVANIYQIDWDKALANGNLDGAVLTHIVDDAAVNGCRPEFVEIDGTAMLATADYGNKTPAIRLYNIEKMLQAKRTSTSGVLAHTIKCGPFNQNLYWDADRAELVCIQNVIAGVGWQLDRINLDAALDGGKVTDKSRVSRQAFTRSSELEGYRPLPNGNSVFVTASAKKNVFTGSISESASR